MLGGDKKQLLDIKNGLENQCNANKQTLELLEKDKKAEEGKVNLICGVSLLVGFGMLVLSGVSVAFAVIGIIVAIASGVVYGVYKGIKGKWWKGQKNALQEAINSDISAIASVLAEIKRQEDEEKRLAEEERKRQEEEIRRQEEQRRKEEAERLKKAEEERKRKEEEKQRIADEKRRQEKEQKRLAEEKKRQEEQRRKEEAERKRQEEAERKRQEEAERKRQKELYIEELYQKLLSGDHTPLVKEIEEERKKPFSIRYLYKLKILSDALKERGLEPLTKEEIEEIKVDSTHLDYHIYEYGLEEYLGDRDDLTTNK